jgi:hypothetical protein
VLDGIILIHRSYQYTTEWTQTILTKTIAPRYCRAPLGVIFCNVKFNNYFIVNLLLTTYKTEEILYFSRFMTSCAVTDVAQNTSQSVCGSGHRLGASFLASLFVRVDSVRHDRCYPVKQYNIQHEDWLCA